MTGENRELVVENGLVVRKYQIENFQFISNGAFWQNAPLLMNC